jgi:hypothetical protein
MVRRRVLIGLRNAGRSWLVHRCRLGAETHTGRGTISAAMVTMILILYIQN